MTEWEAELRKRGGVASKRQLAAAGASDRALTGAVAAGRLLRPRSGVYALSDIGAEALEAVRSGGRLCCVSAARSYGLWGGQDGRTHVLLPPHAGRAGPRDGQVRHWWRSSPHVELWRVSLADCLRSVVRCADRETAVAVLDTALSAGSVSPAGLRRLFAGERLRCRETARLARPGSDSGVESILRQRLMARGHHVEQQVTLPGVGRVDARVDGVLFVEVDGFRFHSGREAFERDRLRDTALTMQGGRRLRFPARQVLEEPDAVVDAVEATLGMLETEESRRAVGS